MKVNLYHNGDDVFIAWKPGDSSPMPGFCAVAKTQRRRGDRRDMGGVRGRRAKDGERRASTDWPIQKYQWTDYMANPGDTLQYRVVPMVGPDKANLQPDAATASGWTAGDHSLAPGHTQDRGVLQPRHRRLAVGLAPAWGDRARTCRRRSSGRSSPRRAMRSATTWPARSGRGCSSCCGRWPKQKRHIYAALYELKDRQLEAALVKIGKKAHVVLANGSVKKKGDDQNAPARKRWRSKIDLHDRMSSPRALGHNKFLVICDGVGKPRWVWTGSQNWTKTGLCTQANNSVLIDDPRSRRRVPRTMGPL